MPQLDLDILEDFLFFAFAGLLLGLGDGEPEENVVARATEAHLAETYLAQRQQLRVEGVLASQVFRALAHNCSLDYMSSLSFLLGALLCGTCLLVTSVSNPVHSLLLLIATFRLGSLLLLFLGREYLALLFLIVYVGAIAVLFLFVVRRLERKRVSVARRLRDIFRLRSIVLALLGGEILLLRQQETFSVSTLFATPVYAAFPRTESHASVNRAGLLATTDTLRALGGVIYTVTATSLLLAARLLFLSRVGARALTLGLGDGPASTEILKSQDPEIQVRRHPTHGLSLVS